MMQRLQPAGLGLNWKGSVTGNSICIYETLLDSGRRKCYQVLIEDRSPIGAVGYLTSHAFPPRGVPDVETLVGSIT
jgi:hypothetical protein